MRVRPLEYARCVVGWLALLVATTTLSANCRGAEAQGRRQSSARITIEFDLPEEFATKAKDGSEVVTGFRVGAFRPNEANPIATVDFAREEVSVNGGAGKIVVESDRFKTDINGAVLRVQTLTREASSVWSDPSTPFAAPTKAAKGSRAANKREAKRLTMDEIERHPRLLEALRKVLPSDTKPEDLAGQFRTAEDLALGVIISEQEKVPLEKLGLMMKGQAGIRGVLRAVNPSLDSRPVARKVRQQAKALLDGAKK